MTRHKHFEHARKIISGWPKWKQQIGWPPKSNVQVSWKTEPRRKE